MGASIPARPPVAGLPPQRLDNGLVWRHAGVPLLHGVASPCRGAGRRAASVWRCVKAHRCDRLVDAACRMLGIRPSCKIRFPIPELFAFAGLAFLLDESFTIYGGNLKSTMAGEFSFSIALTLAMLALGALAAGLRTGKYRVWTAALIAAAAVSHGIVLIFIAVAALVFTALWVDGNRWRWVLTTGITAFLLVAWWVGPFLMNHEYMTDMKYGPRPEGAEDSFWDMFFPLTRR